MMTFRSMPEARRGYGVHMREVRLRAGSVPFLTSKSTQPLSQDPALISQPDLSRSRSRMLSSGSAVSHWGNLVIFLIELVLALSAVRSSRNRQLSVDWRPSSEWKRYRVVSLSRSGTWNSCEPRLVFGCVTDWHRHATLIGRLMATPKNPVRSDSVVAINSGLFVGLAQLTSVRHGVATKPIRREKLRVLPTE